VKRAKRAKRAKRTKRAKRVKRAKRAKKSEKERKRAKRAKRAKKSEKERKERKEVDDRWITGKRQEDTLTGEDGQEERLEERLKKCETCHNRERLLISIIIALAWTSRLVKAFGHVIKTTREAPLAKGVDITKEERLEKCQTCHNNLVTITHLVAPLSRRSGSVGSNAKDLASLLKIYVPEA
jgi:hypothetical protein